MEGINARLMINYHHSDAVLQEIQEKDIPQIPAIVVTLLTPLIQNPLESCHQVVVGDWVLTFQSICKAIL